MKKIFAILSSVIIALCFTACSNDIETVIDSAKPIKLNITVGNLNNEDGTRAVKTGWETGDKIYIWYDENKSKTPDLVIKKAASGWVEDTEATTSGNTPKTAGGVIKAMYLGHQSISDLSDAVDIDGVDYLEFKQHSYEDFLFGHPIATDLLVYSKNRSYTFTNETLEVNISNWLYLFNTQIIVKDIPAGQWAMRNQLLSVARGIDWSNSVHNHCGKYYDPLFALGQTIDEGVVFYFNYTESDKNFDLELIDLDNGGYSRSKNYGVRDLSRAEDKLTSILVSFSDFH